MKYGKLREARSEHLLVPALNHRLSTHPLKYIDALVYGALIYRSRAGRGDKIGRIRRSTGLDRTTIRQSINRLMSNGCVQQHDDGYEAIEPQADSRQLFSWKTTPCDAWQSRFVYDKTYLPAEESGLTPIWNALFWRLVSQAVPVEGRTGHLMVGPGAKVSSLSNEYLAKGLRCSRKTVAAGLQYLQKHGLIHLHPLDGKRRFAVGIFPLASHVHLWKSRQSKQQAGISFEDLFGQASNSATQPDAAYRPQIFGRLARHGIPSKTQEEIVALVHRYCIPDLDLNRILQLVKKDHKRNRDRNPSLLDHCGQLLLAELTRRGESGEWRIYSEGITSTILTSSEMQVRDYLNGMKVCSNAYRLLRQISVDKSVELNNRDRLPVNFCWDEIWELGRESQGFDAFRDKVANHLFPSNKKPRSEWLEDWLKCSRVPELESWPNDLIPLPKAGRGFVNTIHSWAVDIVGCDDLDAATLTNHFIWWIQNEEDVEWRNPAFNRWRVLQQFQKYADTRVQSGLIDQFFE
jgi:biotin operon repressor